MRVRHATMLVLALLLLGGLAPAEGLGTRGPTNLRTLIGLRDQWPSTVDGAGVLHEDWGTVVLRLEGADDAARKVTLHDGYLPMSEHLVRSGSCEMRVIAFRAPTFGQPADALRAEVTNRSAEPAQARLVLSSPALSLDATLTEAGLGAGPRLLVSLPAYVRPALPEREWGCRSGQPLPAWASPSEPCDPAFRNIRVGFNGEPVAYTFRVTPGARATVVLGLCESHWAEPAQRPLLLRVEGAAERPCDPVGEWGRHVPRCLRFDAADTSNDGRLDVAVLPGAGAADRNTILNAIWVFPPEMQVDLDAVKRGELSTAATCYVDVGGAKDQSLYTAGDVIYDLTLQPGAQEELTFLVAGHGVSAPRGPETHAAADRLLAQTEGLWTAWLAEGCRIELPDRELTDLYHASLCSIMMARDQANGYYAYKAGERSGPFSPGEAALITMALDSAGQHRAATQGLRLFWEQPLPDPWAALAQTPEGVWEQAPEGDASGQALVLVALGEHYLLTGDRAWLERAYPAMLRGAQWLSATCAAASTASPDGWAVSAPVAGVGLLFTARCAEELGKAEDAVALGGSGRQLLQAALPAGGHPAAGPRSAGAQPMQELAPEPGTTEVSPRRWLWRAAGRALIGDLETAEGILAASVPYAALDRSWALTIGTPTREGTGMPDSLAGALYVTVLHSLLLRAPGNALVLMPGVPQEWLVGTGLAAEALPSPFGPVSFRARYAPDAKALLVAVQPPTRAQPEALLLSVPPIAGRRPVRAEVGGESVRVEEGSVLHLAAAAGPLQAKVFYE